jgi:hypothetical protein
VTSMSPSRFNFKPCLRAGPRGRSSIFVKTEDRRTKTHNNSNYDLVTSISVSSAFLPLILSTMARRSVLFGGGIVMWAALSSLQSLIFLSTTSGKVAAVPTPSPTTDRYPFWNNLQHCVDRLVLSDENSDNQIEEGEYFRFIIGSTTGSSDTPLVDGVELPDLLIGTFWSELLPQGSTSIDISGAKSDQNRTSEQQEQLEEVCYATGKAIFQTLEDGWAPPRPPTKSPAPTLTPSPIRPPVARIPITDYPFWSSFQQCVDQLAKSDEDNDDQLEQQEYAHFVISGTGSFDPLVAVFYLPDLLVETFSDLAITESGFIDIEGSKSGHNRTAEQQAHLEEVCYATGKAICQALDDGWAPPRPPTKSPAPTLTPSPIHPPSIPSPSTDNLPYWSDYLQCFIGLAVGDGDRNDRLDEKREYLRFIGLALGLSIGDFSDLPDLLQQNFWDLASPDTGMIDVTGSRPGQDPTDEQKAHLENICYATGKAISQALEDDSLPGAISTPSSVLVATSTPSPIGSLWSFTQCITAMIVSDLDRNDRVDPSEYIRFVNRGASNEWGSPSFQDLPKLLQDNFSALANSGEGIDIWGLKPGQDPTEEQTAHLENVCYATGKAISQALEDDSLPGALPTPSPVLIATSPPSPIGSLWSFTQCTTAMILSDRDRNDRVDPSEYVRFVSRGANNEWGSSSFEDLPKLLQDNFSALENAGEGIDIWGSKPGQDPTDVQKAH